MPLSGSNSPSSRAKQQRPSLNQGGLRRTSAYASRRDSAPLQDEDARLVMDSIYASRRLDRNSRESAGQSSPKENEKDPEYMQASTSLLGASRRDSPSPGAVGPQQNGNMGRNQGPPLGLFDSPDANSSDGGWKPQSAETTPRAKKMELADRDKRSSLFDPSLHPARSSISPVRNGPSPNAPSHQNKVMTPAQFERYRREQEMTRTKSNDSRGAESDDDSDHYEDDDEAERSKELAKQRRKQEAHLAVYRQQMMKVTGEQPADLPDIGPPRPGIDRASMSAPHIGQRGPTPTFTIDRASVSGKASDDEDEDVPLGVLAAHGFPSKNRPPAAPVNGGIRYTSETYPPPTHSTSGASAAGGSRGLPPFAKNLPTDPYYGAGLVNPSNRETPSFSHHGGGSQYGGSSPNLPPGGLVGVIAGEERARAARRGSPNAQGNYGSPFPQGMQQMQMGMPPGMPPMISPGDEAQIQMSQQMTQMMQMQMQWMQQMQQMMASGTQQPAQPGMPPAPPSHGQQPINSSFLLPQSQLGRPMSHSAPSSPALAQQQQRAMSMLTPGAAGPQWLPQLNRKTASPNAMSGALGTQSYAPSIAPSERSNVGMPSRYRPVSTLPVEDSSRPGSALSNNLQTGAADRRNNISSAGKTSPVPLRKIPSDDDDEEGWEEMRKKKEQKASNWRLKKNHGNDLKDLYYPGT